MDMVQLIQRCIDDLPIVKDKQNKPNIILAYSGGVDSEVLAQGLSLFAKQQSQFNCQLVHVHHGLSDNADHWASHCQQQALRYQLPYRLAYVEVKQAPRLSVEAQARAVRYQALLAEMQPGDILMSAHHQDDQLETMLLALKRGLGPKGLAAMGRVQAFNKDKWLIRPLLDMSKHDIERYAAQRSIAHIEDESNADEKYDRNFLRQSIIPLLKQRWSAIAATASRSAELCAMQQTVVDEEIALRLPTVERQQGTERVIDLAALAQHSAAWQALLLRGHMNELGFAPPSKVQSEQILAQLLTAKEDANIEIKLTDVIIKRFKGAGYCLPAAQVSALRAMTITSFDDLLAHGIDYGGSKRLNAVKRQGAGIRFPRADEQVSIEFSLPGSTRCHPEHRHKGRELKKLWQEFAIPPWQRGQVPLLCYNGKLVCAVGYWQEKSFLCLHDEFGLVIS